MELIEERGISIFCSNLASRIAITISYISKEYSFFVGAIRGDDFRKTFNDICKKKCSGNEM